MCLIAVSVLLRLCDEVTERKSGMTRYGGLGGVPMTLPLDPADKFQATINRVLGDRIRADDQLACAMWCALANVDWKHKDGDTAGYSFRAAGDLVAAIRGSGYYMN